MKTTPSDITPHRPHGVLLVLLFGLTLLLANAWTVRAQADYSIAATGVWTNAATWSPSITGGPTSIDSIVITSSTSYTVTLDGAVGAVYSINDLTQSGTTGGVRAFSPLSGSGAKTLNIGGDINIGGAGGGFRFADTSGTPAGSLTVNVAGVVNVSTGLLGLGSAPNTPVSSFTATGLTTVSSGARIDVGAGSAVTFAGGMDLQSGGTFNRIRPSGAFTTIAGLTGAGTMVFSNTDTTARTAILDFTQSSNTSTYTGNIQSTTSSTGTVAMSLRRGANGGGEDGAQILRGIIQSNTSTTQINGGVLAFAGNASLTAGNIQLDNTTTGVGAILGVSSNMTRALGTGNNQIQMSGAGAGFAAYDNDATVSLGAAVTWGAANFTMTNLVLGHSSADRKVTLSSGIGLGSTTRTVVVHNGSAAVDGALSGVLSGTGGLTKTGAGALELTGTNTYSGATTVSEGLLVVNGSVAGTMTVDSGSVLGGSGSIAGATTISGSLRPGNSIGTLTVANDVTWNGGEAWVFELGGAGPSLAAPGTSDFLSITGAGSDFLKGTGSTWTFDFAGTGAEGWYKLVEWDGTSDFDATNFTGINLGGGFTSQFSIQDKALYLNVVPEPSTYAMLVLAAAGLAAHQVRRRRRQKN